MANSFDAEAAKKIIYQENVNVTKNNPLKDLFKMAVNIAVFVAIFYLFLYFFSGFLLMSLPEQKQVQIENFISSKFPQNTISLSDEEKSRLKKIKNQILKVDPKFPKTSNLDINVISSDELNALCYPNGNIYITDLLYKELKSDDELAFVIAHEMAHYKYKDHLLNLRHTISNIGVLIVISILSPNNRAIETITSDGLDISTLTFSRRSEEKADRYAVKIMNTLYGNTKAGVKVMETLKDKNAINLEFLSTHPNIEKRIKYIKKSSAQ